MDDEIKREEEGADAPVTPEETVEAAPEQEGDGGEAAAPAGE